MTGRARVTLIDRAAIAAATTSVIVPARDEADRIAACLSSLAAQKSERRPAVYLCVNNTRDDTAGIARDVARATGLPLVLIEVEIARGGVGRARRVGHAAVARYGQAAQAMLSTDADCVVAPGWLRHMEEGLERAPVVLGHIGVCAEELARFPESFHVHGRTEERYIVLSMEFERLLAPMGAEAIGLNTAGGANLGVRADVYRRLGGIASLSVNEDRDLIDRAIRHGYVPIRVPEAVVHASMRTEGRARDGMSDAVAERLAHENYALDIALAPFASMLARHVGPRGPCVRMRREDAARDLAALASCVTAMRQLDGLEARRALVSARFEAYRSDKTSKASAYETVHARITALGLES